LTRVFAEDFEGFGRKGHAQLDLAAPGRKQFSRSGYAFTPAFGRMGPIHRVRDEWGIRVVGDFYVWADEFLSLGVDKQT
jgi:hypothetical protein